MKTAFYVIFFKSGLFENGVIRQEIGPGTCLIGLSHNGKKPIYQFCSRFAPGIGILIDVSVAFDLYGQSGGQRIYNGGTDTVKTAAGLIGIVIELTAGMECRINNTLCADTLGVHLYGDTTAVIGYRCGTVCFQDHIDLIAISCKMFIHGVIQKLKDQMIQTFCGCGSDIHSGPHPYCFKAL